MENSTMLVSDLSKRFGSGPTEVTAVRQVSLTIEPGEVVLIMGPSGSGKTTLLMMLGALLRPTEGSIRLNGQVISELSEGKLPMVRLHQFGFIFQDFNLLSALTALENVALVASLSGRKNGEARRKAEELLSQLGLEQRLHFLPEKLSGGEKQRVAIARALVNNPAILFADEPTANLDSKIGHEIMRLLRTIAKEQSRSVVIVSHDPRIKDIADRVLWLEDGQFKDMVRLATDPVCGMSVEQDGAAHRLDYRGSSYYFCARGCLQEFAATPERFTAGNERTVLTRSLPNL
jgi:putative ABC transport system ATP-binding protein